ncbi:hypothetical protein SNE40_001863 [Patella caerulea]|uniref:Eukaryotic translation initiation factor 4E transporter n=2 Tax=Patella caerulea TaxID=87958 RepID=A0AAN8QDQ6_PATCE
MDRDGGGRESGRDSTGSGSVDDEVRSEPLRKDTPGPMPQYQYNREKLQEIQESASAKKRPSYLSPLYDNADGIWDPEKWCKSFNPEGREGSPITLGEIRERKRPLELDRDLLRRKPPVDAKERLKEEQDGIVLSPQRRSFGTGCHVSQTSSLARQSSTTSDYADDRDRGGDRRERRIGSGRIQIDRDQGRDYRGRYDRDDRDRIDERDRHDDRGDRRFERNDRFRRDYDDRRDFRDSRDIRDRDNRVERSERGDRERDLRDTRDRDPRNLRNRDPRDNQHRDYNRDRDNHRYSSGRRSHHHEEEPEWFTAGPTSKSDTIELQGFERDGDAKENQAEEVREPAPKKEKIIPKETKEEKEEKDKGTNFGDRNGSLETNESSSPEAVETRPSPTSMFDFNQFFHVGSIPGLHDEPESTEGDTGSRFSRWFAQATGSKENSRRSSINDDYQFEYLNDILKESRSPVPLIPSPTPPPIPNVFDKGPMFPHFSNMEDKTSRLETALHHKNMAALNPNVNHMFMANTPNLDRGNASISNNQGMFSPQDAEAHLKAMLFGRRKDSGSSSGTSSPAGGSRLKTVAELEAGFHQNSPSSSARMSPIQHQQQMHQHQHHQQQQQQHHQHQQQQMHQQQQQQQQQSNKSEEDLTAFNKLLSLMTAGAGSGSPEPPNSQMMPQDNRQMSPLTSTAGMPPGVNMATSQFNSKFMEAVMRNREQQMHLQQQALTQMRFQQPTSQPHPLPQHMLPPQQQMAGTQRPITQDRMLANFLQQNPTIITKPPSPAVGQIPNIVHNTSTPRIGQSPTPIMANNLLQKQHQQPSAPRIPSPIMFSQQPPMHLNAPSPIHPSQLGRAMPNNNTLSTSPTMLNRIPSPQELIAHNQAILQSALIKKQLEDQKERFLKKQQDRAKSPGLISGQNRPVTNQSMMSSTTNTVQTASNNKTTMTPAFTPTSVMRKMHSDKASEKEKGKPDGEDIMNRAPIKQLIQDGQGDHMDLKRDGDGTDINGLIDQSLTQDMNKLQMGGGPGNMQIKSVRAVVGNSQNTQNQIPAPVSTQQAGRPIFKSFNASQANMNIMTSTPQPQQIRAVTPGGINIPTSSTHRPITGGVGNLQQPPPQPQMRPNVSTPLPRQGLASSTQQQFGIPITGRMPIQSNVLPGQVHHPAANALLMQQMIQNNTANAAARVNVMNQLNQLHVSPMNQLNQINQLAALQAQQRMMDPRLQGMRGVYPGNVPPMLSPRSNATTSVGMVSPTNSGISRAISPAKLFPFPQKQNGPLSPNVGNILQQNNSPEGNIFNKLFGGNVLKSQLPSMPPLPVQGQRVMTVDEIERS